MTTNPRILIYSFPGTPELLDPSILSSYGFEVIQLTHLQAIDAWVNTFTEETLLIITHPSAREGLDCCTEFIANQPIMPVILVSQDSDELLLRQALHIDLVDLLAAPVDPSSLLSSIKRGLARQKSWIESRRFTLVLEGLEDGVIFVDQFANLVLINPSARHIFSLDESAYAGKPVSEVLTHPDLLDLFQLHNQSSRRSEVTLETGKIFSAQASQIPNIGTVVILQDITHLKELDRIKTDFVNTVSHDLRSPLTAIYGFVGLIDRVGPVNEQQADFIRHIQSSVQHITELINDLLELGRVEADHDIQMEDVDLREIIINGVNSLNYQLNEKMQQISLVLPEIVPPILGNPTHLQRMVCNLVENAIKFTPPLGTISVCCKAEATQLILEVSDNGHGIPLDDQPHVFEKFYRGMNIATSIPGTGLGLSIVKSIVEKHHGRIWLDSSPAGTTFTVILPLK